MIGTLVDLVRHHAQRAPEDLAYSSWLMARAGESHDIRRWSVKPAV